MSEPTISDAPNPAVPAKSARTINVPAVSVKVVPLTLVVTFRAGGRDHLDHEHEALPVRAAVVWQNGGGQEIATDILGPVELREPSKADLAATADELRACRSLSEVLVLFAHVVASGV